MEWHLHLCMLALRGCSLSDAKIVPTRVMRVTLRTTAVTFPPQQMGNEDAAGDMAMLYGAVGGVRMVYVLGPAIAPYPTLLALAGVLADESRQDEAYYGRG